MLNYALFYIYSHRFRSPHDTGVIKIIFISVKNFFMYYFTKKAFSRITEVGQYV